jgi:hypothetical protein
MACVIAGISPQTLARWGQDDPSVYDRLDQAEAEWVAERIAGIVAIADNTNHKDSLNAQLALLKMSPAARRLLSEDAMTETKTEPEESPEEVAAWLAGVAELIAKGNEPDVPTPDWAETVGLAGPARHPRVA